MRPIQRRASSSDASSQIALEIIIHLYALFCVLVVARIVLHVGTVDSRVWIGRLVYRFTDPLVKPFQLLPGADRQLIGTVTLPDLTILAIAILIPLGVSLRRGDRSSATGQYDSLS